MLLFVNLHLMHFNNNTLALSLAIAIAIALTLSLALVATILGATQCVWMNYVARRLEVVCIKGYST